MKPKSSVGRYALPPAATTFSKRASTSSLLFHQPTDTLLLTGFIAAERYPILERRIRESYGHITQDSLMEIIKEPIARASNLHNAIFHPSSLRVWVSHAGAKNEPACNQPYTCFNLSDLLKTH